MPFLVRLGTTSAIATNGSGTEGTTMITVPVSSTYKTTCITLVDSSRNASGDFVGTVLPNGIKRKIELSWRVISVTDYAKLGSFFINNFTFWAYYFDQDTKLWLTKECYVGDRVADALKQEQLETVTVSGEQVYQPKHIENFKISFIEV